jgi:hypothetical protein
MATGNFRLPDNFAERCKDIGRRIAAGEPMTLQHLADALGLPFEFISAAVAISEALATGRPVLVDPSPAKRPH